MITLRTDGTNNSAILPPAHTFQSKNKASMMPLINGLTAPPGTEPTLVSRIIPPVPSSGLG